MPLDASTSISIHALHEESDRHAHRSDPPGSAFQSTLSMRRATLDEHATVHAARFQSTLSMRRATGRRRQSRLPLRISIHALHEESDRISCNACMIFRLTFQSTLSMRRATPQPTQAGTHHIISIHALHEESDLHDAAIAVLSGISIHALHEESDRPITASITCACYFNPRSP